MAWVNSALLQNIGGNKGNVSSFKTYITNNIKSIFINNCALCTFI